jgi:protein tyrosine phosphatase (PTP) superfamily phosphohydrolase (DUF442 family)
MCFRNLLVLAILVALRSAAFAGTYQMSLEGDRTGVLPNGWVAAKTGSGAGSVWMVVSDASVPSGKAIAQTSPNGPNGLFNLCVLENARFTDIDLEVAFKAIAGKLDRGGGPVWRYRDAKNYYVARMNPLEDNFRVYKVVDGKRTQLDSAEVKVPSGEWHSIRVVHCGDHIRCCLDAKLMLDVRDNTFSEAGSIGLWTKADAVTHFDGLQVKQPAAMVPERITVPKEYSGLRHVLEAGEGIWSGSEPEGGEGFESLRKLGFTTIISVDGARPDVETAAKHGLRYVHIPFGYNGIPAEAGAALAKAAHDLKGPIFVHCHHGLHRGPAAAAVACIASGKTDHQQAIAFLGTAGTSKEYTGLWRDVANYVPPTKDAKLPELKAATDVGSFTLQMVEIGRGLDHLKLCQDAGWQPPRMHLDLVPSREAALLRDALQHARKNRAGIEDKRFQKLMSNSSQLAGQLVESLQAGQKEEASTLAEALTQSCAQCHKAYRD